MHEHAREHISEWRHLHGNMSLETNNRENRRQSARRHALAETWTEVWGDEVGALAPKEFFLPSPQYVTFGGRRGTHCDREFQYLTH